METLSYTTVDKSAWGDGPWQAEPDKMQWQDERTGLPCLIVRGPMGALCGYVGVATTHPAYGLSYDGAPDDEHRAYHKALREKLSAPLAQNGADGHEAVRAVLESDALTPPEPTPVGEQIINLNVHGGLTFAGGCHEGDPATGICHIPAPGEPDDVWWFGFDCTHAGDLAPLMELTRKDVEYLTQHIPVPPLLKQFREEHPDLYRDIAYVQAEVADLAKQLAEVRP